MGNFLKTRSGLIGASVLAAGLLAFAVLSINSHDEGLVRSQPVASQSPPEVSQSTPEIQPQMTGHPLLDDAESLADLSSPESDPPVALPQM